MDVRTFTSQRGYAQRSFTAAGTTQLSSSALKRNFTMAAELFDPFEVVREEVQESVGRAEALAASFADPDDPWRQQGPSPPSSSST